jgi:S-adenosylmethionine/arginine decarboxylase-like enzyme
LAQGDKRQSFPDAGHSGEVAMFAETHISIHTWPEHAYAAVDIFLCAPKHELEAALGGARRCTRSLWSSS